MGRLDDSTCSNPAKLAARGRETEKGQNRHARKGQFDALPALNWLYFHRYRLRKSIKPLFS
jgi:hypothetical protein